MDCKSVQSLDMKKIEKEPKKRPFKLSYLRGAVEGLVKRATISLGSFEISKQVFGRSQEWLGVACSIIAGAATEIRDMGLSSANHSGILGFGFPSGAMISIGSSSTILENIFSNVKEADRFFAFKLGETSGSNDPTSGLSIAGLDQDFAPDFSDFFFYPVSKVGSNEYDYWKLPLRYITIDSIEFPLSPSRIRGAADSIAVLDSGTTLALGPTADVDEFYASFGDDAEKNEEGMWEIPCDKAVAVGFVFGDDNNSKEIMLDPGDISWEEGGSEGPWCMGGIQANDGVCT
jgi:hypothetical protein